MRTIIEKNIAGEFYDSPDEFIRINLARKKLPYEKCKDYNDHFSDSYQPGKDRIKWQGFTDQRDLLNQFEKSDLCGLSPTDIKKSFKIPTQKQVKTVYYADVVGCVPIVPNYIAGIPEQMLNIKTVNIPSKVISVYVDVGMSCGYSTNDYKRQGMNIMSHIVALERQGYRINLYQCWATKYHKSVGFLCIKVKDARDRMNIQRVMYPIVNPSFLRGIGFGWSVRCPILLEYQSDKGIPLIDSSSGIDLFRKSVCGTKGIYISLQGAVRDSDSVRNDINEFVKGVKPQNAIV